MDESIRLRSPKEQMPVARRRNTMNFVFVTGDAHAIPADSQDRRFTVIRADVSTTDPQAEASHGDR
jgi:hypothetical protein